MKFQDLSGQTFGRLTVLNWVRINKRCIKFRCRCVCGQETIVFGSSLKNGHTKSCGCLHNELFGLIAKVTSRKHGGHGTKTYRVWSSMRRRCYDPRDASFYNYGRRGVKICKRWDDFEAFRSDMGETPNGMSIDRKNNALHYSCGKCPDCISQEWPANCQWATAAQQARNRRKTKLYTFNGKTACPVEFAEIYNLPRHAVAKRLRRGWSIERTLTEPMHKEFDSQSKK